jgi:hypothetical protein
MNRLELNVERDKTRTGKWAAWLLLAGVLGAGQVAFGAPVSPGLPTYSWLFDSTSGTTATASTGGVNGTLENGAAFNTDTPFAYTGNRSVSLDGVNDDVNLTANTGFKFTNTSFTVNFWIKTPSMGASPRRMMLFAKGDAASTYGNDGNSWAYGIELPASAGSPLAAYVLRSSTNYFERDTTATNIVATGTWHQIAVVFKTSASPDITIYVDGVSQANTLFTNVFIPANYLGAPNVPLRLGGRSFGSGVEAAPNSNTSASGLFDELAIYNRALSSDEVLWLDQNSAFLLVPEPASLGLLLVGGLLLARRR